MNGPDILANLREELTLQLKTHNPPMPEPLAISPWLAMSLLQKAVRRGHRQYALQAGATLLHQSQDRFWRRCAIIAFEDVGVADLNTVALVVASLAGKSLRAKLGGEWPVASYLIQRLVHATKCRAADDLIFVAERHPAYDEPRLDLTYRSLPNLIAMAISSTPLPERALALWFAIGTDRCPSRDLRTRGGAPDAVFDSLCETGFPHTVVEVAREGFRKTGQLLCPLFPLLVQMRPSEPTAVSADDFPPETLCGLLPSWAVDMFSRDGRKALALFLQTDCMTARWVRRHIPTGQQIDFLGNMLFFVESGLLKNRYRWSVGDGLRRMAERECHGPHCPDASALMDMLRADIGILNEERHHVL